MLKSSVEEHSLDDALARLERRQKLNAEAKALQQELANHVTADTLQAEISQDVVPIGSKEICDRFRHNIDQQSQLGLFYTVPVAERNVWPSLLCRLPIFPPISRARQKKYLNKDNALVFETVFGSGKRYGPNLDTFDEDVLFALSRLRERRLLGQHEKLPIKVPLAYRADKNGHVPVEILICTVAQVLDEMGYEQVGGDNYQDVKDAVERLGNTSISLELRKHNRYLGNYEHGRPFKLIDVEWVSFSSDTTFYVQFSPLVSQWLEESFTYLNYEIRRKLGRKFIAKALHKFLSSQPAVYTRKLEEIAETIGVYGPLKEQNRQIKEACAELINVGYLEGFEIEGTGRKTPFVLTTLRKT